MGRGMATLLLAVLLLGSAAPAQAEETVYIRVVGRDDTDAGQAEKLRVRDAVLSCWSASSGALPDALPRIARAAGLAAPCRVELRPWRPALCWPVRLTLYITVGEGRGHNWWGLLYGGSLAMARAEDPGETDGPVEFVWPVWSWLRALFGW